MEKIYANEVTGAGVSKASVSQESLKATGVYKVTCTGADGQVRWEDTIQNLVTTVGKNDLLDKYFAGSAYTATWYVGLVDGASTPTYSLTDTSASHTGWTENVSYSNSNRPTPAFNAASAGSKATTATAFNISGTATIAGTFLIANNTKSGTTGVLYSAGSFTGGNKSVANGDTLNVTYTTSV